ncbi:hypothetical protein KY335_03805 [Candidatus Woesearchaeota archaeon]|nr:hypothetical protein [Candidatus Woesearchaeota archaeon]
MADPRSIYDTETEGLLKKLLKSKLTMLLGMAGLSLGATAGINAVKEDTLNIFNTEAELNITNSQELEELVDYDQHPDIQAEIVGDLEDISKECKNGLEYEAKSILIRKAIDAGLRSEVQKRFLNADLRKAVEEGRMGDIDKKILASVAWYAISSNTFNEQAYVDIAEQTLVKLDEGSVRPDKTEYVKKLFRACAKDGVFNEEEMQYIAVHLLERLMERPKDDQYRQAIERKLGELYMRHNTDRKKEGLFEND